MREREREREKLRKNEKEGSAATMKTQRIGTLVIYNTHRVCVRERERAREESRDSEGERGREKTSETSELIKEI